MTNERKTEREAKATAAESTRETALSAASLWTRENIALLPGQKTESQTQAMLSDRSTSDRSTSDRSTSDRSTSDRAIIASSDDGFAIVGAKTEAPAKPQLDVEEKGIISVDYRRRVDHFLQSLPPEQSAWAKAHGIRVAIFNNSSQIPESMRKEHAQGHPKEETVGHVPMFYNPATKTLVFIEHPDLTNSEQQSKDRFDQAKAYNESRAVKVYGQLSSFDPKAQHYAPIERNGNHEFGHALDQAGNSAFTSTKGFDDAFHKGLSRLSDSQKKRLYYFVEADQNMPKGHEYDRAKRELFAELYSIEHTPKGYGQPYDVQLVAKFKEVVDLIKRDEDGLAPYEPKKESEPGSNKTGNGRNGMAA